MSTTGVERASSYLTESTQTHQRAIEDAMAFKYPCEAQLRLDTKSLASAQKVDPLADLVLPDDHEPVQLRLQKKLMANCDLDWLCAAGWTAEEIKWPLPRREDWSRSDEVPCAHGQRQQ